ncbi:DUF6479 family protein [Streptomyces sp. NPDC020681]|uniref:DUF6479 family protein n=1 Tax=Streptomyces sp. NPDC020681 TaxID=3365083 RepID=UPI0037B54194
MIGFMIGLGFILIVLLAGAMWWDNQRREQEIPPKPEEQPTPPDHPHEHIEEVRASDDDDFPHDGERLLPYNLKTHSTHSTGKGREARAQHGENSGGGFGSGRLGG